MTHTRQYRDSEGEFAPWQPEALPCRECGGHVLVRKWESGDGGFEDYQFKCIDCRRVWWVDGIDS
jgi:hypothetical protein